MNKKEKDEIKEIVSEAMEENKKELKKEKKSKKKIIIISSIVGGLLLIAAVLFFILFVLKPTYKVTVNTNGKKLIKDIVVEDNEIKELPEIELSKNEYLVAWVTDKGEAIRPGLPLDGDLPIEPIIGDPSKELVTISFETGTDEKIEPIKIQKGSGLILPVKPKNYKDWKFLYWVDKDEYVALIGTPVKEDITIYAYWWKPTYGGTPRELVTISFDTGTDEKLDDIDLPIGSKYIFRTPEKGNGKKVFRGWIDEDGKELNEKSEVTKAMTLKAIWKDPYTCPEGCTPSEDGKTCTKKTTVAPSTEDFCPATSWTNDYGMTYCIDVGGITEDDCMRQCSSGYPFGDTEVDYPYDWKIDETGYTYQRYCCAKKVGIQTRNTCPAGYERDGDNCTLTETINCTAN